MSKEIHKYCEDLSNQDDQILNDLKEYAYKNEKMYQMICGPIVGNFLSLMIKILQPKNVLEIGTYLGYSSIKMAQELPEDGKIDTCELMEQHASTAQNFIDKTMHKNKIKIHIGDALKTIQNFSTSSFDMAFIDADKINYLNYYMYASRLVKKGGYIILDNMLWGGEVLDPKSAEGIAIRETAEYINNDQRTTNFMVPIRDGLMVVQVNE